MASVIRRASVVLVIAVALSLWCSAVLAYASAGESGGGSDKAAASQMALTAARPGSLDTQATTLPDLTLYDIDGSAAKTLNGTYGGTLRVVIVGRPSCYYTRNAVEAACELSTQDAYKDINFIVLDCDGDFEAFKEGFASKETSAVRFYSSGDGTYNSWAWDSYYAAHEDAEGGLTLPFLVLIDKKGNAYDWTGNAYVPQAIFDSFGVKGSSYEPLLKLPETEESSGTYAIKEGGAQDEFKCLGFGTSQIAFTSSNESVAKVSASGVVTSGKPGDAVITAKASNGLSASVNVHVYGNPVSLKLAGTSRADDAYKALSLVNAERKKAGVPELQWDSRLEDAALKRAAETMICPGSKRPTLEPYKSIAGWSPNLMFELCGLQCPSANEAITRIMDDSYDASALTYAGFKSVGVACFVDALHNCANWVILLSDDEPNGERMSTGNSKTSVTIEVASDHLMLGLPTEEETLITGKTDSLSLDAVVWFDTTSYWPYEAFDYYYKHRVAWVFSARVAKNSVTWVSSDTAVASVDASGKVVAKRGGTATITASAAGKKMRCKVTVLTIADAQVFGLDSQVYTGATIEPLTAVTLGGYELAEGTDYTVSYKNNKRAGKATAIIKGAGKCKGTKTVKFTIKKAKNPLAVKAVAKTVKLAKGKTKLAKAKVLKGAVKITKKGKGTVTYTRVTKGSSNRLTINKKTGRITVKKGTKRGTYRIKVKVRAAGNANYKARAKTVTVKVVVK